ncbi:helix-turn-helix domain-containing protein [Microbacterium sp. RD1]|uniref:helix-turn-helix domain-containing protein n=1 Tax=Microbacterium sp. RD1 TaxID=3457313 RepID=UPI003FA53D86
MAAETSVFSVASLIARIVAAASEDRWSGDLVADLDQLARLLSLDELGRTEIEGAMRRSYQAVRRLRTHERQLAALFATASEIALQSDLDEALVAIVHRARQLLGSDVTYLMMLNAEAGETYMRATEGAVTADFRSIRLPVGFGLGGVVVAEGAPHWTADYAADDRFLHPIDEVVRAENIVAILGVPLRVGSRVIGVLFAADRYVREFTPDEVSLLCSLADHAAIAIEAKSYLAEKEEAVNELADAQQELREYAHAIARSADVHEQLVRLVTVGGSATEVLDLLAEKLDRTVILCDRAGEIRESGSALASESAAPELRPILDEVATTMRPVTVEISRESRIEAFPVAVHGELQAFLVVLGEPLPDLDRRTAERAALVVAFLEMFDEAHRAAEERVKSSFLLDLIASGVPEADLETRARLLGLTEDKPYRIVVADVGTDLVLGDGGWAFASVRPLIMSRWHGRIVMLVDGGPEGGDIRALHGSLQRMATCRVTMGYSRDCRTVKELRAAYEQAVRCVDALLAFGRVGDVSAADDLGALGFLLRAASPGAIGEFVNERLEPLIAHDDKRGTNLLATAQTYLELASSPGEAARRLGIHVNTLYQRLDRVSQLLGEDWRVGDRALELQLALTLRRSLVGEASALPTP